ncbi:carbohydrate kinase family protein [Chloroflexota bacterium]
MADIIALGDVNADIIARFPEYPAKGQNSVALSSEFHGGGSAANTVMALAQMGLRVGLIARVGSDPWGLEATQALAAAGVDLSNLQRDPEALTGVMYIVVTPDGERTMLGDRGANALTDPEEIEEATFSGARLFYLSGYALLVEPQRSAALRGLACARHHGLAVALDPGLLGSEAAREEVRSLLPETGVFLPSRDEATALTGLSDPTQCLEAFLDQGVQVVALKLGRDGCLVGSDSGRYQVPAFAVAARDSTGAGDSFAAGFLAAHLAGLDLRSAAIVGNALGATTVAHVGGGNAAPRIKEMLALLKHHQSDPAFGEHSPAFREAIDFIERIVASNR